MCRKVITLTGQADDDERCTDINKSDLNANAELETQLVPMSRSATETLVGKVDLEKVRDIRRAIRRRYANKRKI